MSNTERSMDVGGRSLYVRQGGAGANVVVLCSAAGQGVDSWMKVEPGVAEFATALSYERAGVGRSSPPPSPPTALDMVADLHALLGALGLRDRPLTLVGNALGGLLVQLYACTYPKDVVGLVLLDPTPDELLASLAHAPPGVREDMRALTVANARKAGFGPGGVMEMEKLIESSLQVQEAVVTHKRMPGVPVTMITAGIAVEAGKTSTAGLSDVYKRLLARFARGRHIVAQKSTHKTVLNEEPALIVGAIHSVLSGSAPPSSR